MKSMKPQMKSMRSVRRKRDDKLVGMEAGVRSFVKHKNSKSERSDDQKHGDTYTIEEAEAKARRKQQKNPFILAYQGYAAALKVFVYYLLTIDTIMACSLCVILTCYWYFVNRENEANDNWYGGGMDWIILGFAVVTPMTSSLSMAFQRRERALFEISRVRSFSFQIYLAHSLWDWPDGGGRAGCHKDWLEHCDKVLAQLIGIGDELCRFLSLPTSSRSRHRLTHGGRRDAARVVKVAYRLLDSMATQRMTRLTTYDERLKKAGLPATEVSRLRQYERFMGEAMENLRQLKMYRTPQVLRSFARIFTLILPAFYAPTFAQLAFDVNSLGMGIAFGLLVAFGLSGLFETIQVLEDPFVGFITLDGINVTEEFEVLNWQQLVNAREILFPDAPPFPEGTRAALTGEEIPELTKAENEGKRHKKVMSWDQEALTEVDFGSYVGDLRSEQGDDILRERLMSDDNAALRTSQFAPFLEGDEEAPPPATPGMSPSVRLFHKRHGSTHSPMAGV